MNTGTSSTRVGSRMFRSWIRVKGIRLEVLFTVKMFRMDCCKLLNWGRQVSTYANKVAGLLLCFVAGAVCFTCWVMYVPIQQVIYLWNPFRRASDTDSSQRVTLGGFPRGHVRSLR